LQIKVRDLAQCEVIKETLRRRRRHTIQQHKIERGISMSVLGPRKRAPRRSKSAKKGLIS